MADSERLRVCLERTVELDNVRLAVRDWPGFRGPLIHVPERIDASPFVVQLAASLAPGWRVMSVSARQDVPYQVGALDVVGVIRQFGFVEPILVGEGLGCLTAVLVSAWYPDAVAALILVTPTCEPPPDLSLCARSLRECPPDWLALQGNVRCPVFEAAGVDDVQRALNSLP